MPPPDNPTLADPRLQPVSDWLIECGLKQMPIGDMLAGVCEQLNDRIGFQLLRANVSTRTMHPVIDSVTHLWRRDSGIDISANAFADQDLDSWQNSPIRSLVESHDQSPQRTRLDQGDGAFAFPLFEEFRNLGATEYMARLIGFGRAGEFDHRSGMVSTWLTDRSGGFLDSEAATLERLMPRLALSIKSTLGHQISMNLLETYVGHDAGRRILDGAFRRGTFRNIPAAILFADLRGFTTLSDRLSTEAVADLLNACFDAMVVPITRRGGEVLKYMGDGVLAVFDRQDRSDDDLCQGALDAADEAITAVASIAEPDTDKPMMLDVALHLGDVLYGNVGTADRLDFTVIGPAVNEASRIEGLCDRLGYPLLTSPSFAAASERCGRSLKSVGRHHLRGVDTDQELFTIDNG